MGLTDDYDRKQREKAYDKGVARAKRVKVGKEAADSFLHEVPWPVPQSPEYLSDRAGYKDEMGKWSDERTDAGYDRDESSDSAHVYSNASSYSGLDCSSSTPLLERSLGCIFVGGFLCVFGMMFFIGSDFPQLTEHDRFNMLFVAATCLVCGAMMLVWGFIPHEEGSGFFLFLGLAILAGAGTIVIWFIEDFSDLEMRTAWGIPAFFGPIGILGGGALVCYVLGSNNRARRP